MDTHSQVGLDQRRKGVDGKSASSAAATKGTSRGPLSERRLADRRAKTVTTDTEGMTRGWSLVGAARMARDDRDDKVDGGEEWAVAGPVAS